MSAAFADFGAKVAAVGLGACTAAGHTLPAVDAALRAGISPIRQYRDWLTRDGEPMRLAQVPLVADVADVAVRCARLAAAAMAEACGPLSFAVPVVLALPEPRAGLPGDFPARVVAALRKELSPSLKALNVTPVCEGHAGGARALLLAAQLVAERKADAALCVGVDSLMGIDQLEGMEAAGRLLTPATRQGLTPGEAAGAVLLARPDLSGSRPPVRGFVRAASLAVEPKSPDGDEPPLGDGVVAAMRALRKALGVGESIGHSWFDQTGERFRGEDAGFLFVREGDAFADVGAKTVTAPLLGDIGAASALVFAALALNASGPPGERVLISTATRSGLRGLVLLGRPVPTTAGVRGGG